MPPVTRSRSKEDGPGTARFRPDHDSDTELALHDDDSNSPINVDAIAARIQTRLDQRFATRMSTTGSSRTRNVPNSAALNAAQANQEAAATSSAAANAVLNEDLDLSLSDGEDHDPAMDMDDAPFPAAGTSTDAPTTGHTAAAGSQTTRETGPGSGSGSGAGYAAPQTLDANAFLASLARLVSQPPRHSADTNTYRDAFDSIKDFKSKLNVDDWIRYFKLAAVGLSLHQKLRLFRAKLASECYSWYANKESDGKFRTLDDWFAELRQEFGLSPERQREAIVARKQKEGEPPDEFIRDVLSLCKRYHAQMPETEKVAFIRDNVFFKYRRQFTHYNVHAKTVRETEESLRAAMEFERDRASRAVNAVQTEAATGASTAANPRKRLKGKGQAANEPDEETALFAGQEPRSQFRGNHNPQNRGGKNNQPHSSHNPRGRIRGAGQQSARQPQFPQTAGIPTTFPPAYNPRAMKGFMPPMMPQPPYFCQPLNCTPPGQQQPFPQQFQPMYAHQQQGYQQDGFVPPQPMGQNDRRANLRCYKCLGIGHFSAECPSAAVFQNPRGQNSGQQRHRSGQHQQRGPRPDSGNGSDRPESR